MKTTALIWAAKTTARYLEAEAPSQAIAPNLQPEVALAISIL
jgi:hypothetical protein